MCQVSREGAEKVKHPRKTEGERGKELKVTRFLLEKKDSEE